jgi:hypothetical protein
VVKSKIKFGMVELQLEVAPTQRGKMGMSELFHLIRRHFESDALQVASSQTW